MKLFRICLLLSLGIITIQCQNEQDMSSTQENHKMYENLDTALSEANKVIHLGLADYSYKLDEFPDLSVFKYLKHLTWSQEGVNVDYDFAKSPQIESLSFIYSRLNNENTTFKNLHKVDNLENISLLKNDYTNFPKFLNEHTFYNLKRLDIGKNSFKSIEGAWLKNCPNIEELFLGTNKISNISDEMNQLKKLKRLFLSQNNITALPESFSKLPNLEELELSNNNIQILPTNFGKLKRLERLGLSKNQIEIIPKEVFDSKNLISLDLSENQIKEIPSSIQSLTRLQSLYLGRNQIKVFPKELFELKNLKTLFIWRNQLTEIPEAIQTLSKLESLSLSNNHNLRHLPDCLALMPSLKKLDIEETSIPFEEVEAFKAIRPDVEVQYAIYISEELMEEYEEEEREEQEMEEEEEEVKPTNTFVEVLGTNTFSYISRRYNQIMRNPNANKRKVLWNDFKKQHNKEIKIMIQNIGKEDHYLNNKATSIIQSNKDGLAFIELCKKANVSGIVKDNMLIKFEDYILKPLKASSDAASFKY